MKKLSLKSYNGNDKVSLSELTNLIQRGEQLSWYLLEINGYGHPPGETMVEYQDRVTNNTEVVWSKWNEITEIESWLHDLNWFWLVGYERPEVRLDVFEGSLELAGYVAELKMNDSTWVDLRYEEGSPFIHESNVADLMNKYGHWSARRRAPV